MCLINENSDSKFVNVNYFRYLLEAGANVPAHTQTGDTALTYACENGHTDVADLLLQYGANLVSKSFELKLFREV